ncbi:catecholate siderophore receptor [Novosphingobium sp. CF614]|uniref:TonB-dependent receptor n=1 Tax=Novosphingobium sp. CF614 TaxID=1884364 RepID=UPI0008E954F5|nr:TonB-dependent siderophore receptor [Novosphingobium sp. CF614]SFF87495.1 catecholate siderophore receptor [Novosphingobium sp. CF614]
MSNSLFTSVRAVPVSLAAAMLMAGPAFAAEDTGEADRADQDAILVKGQHEEIDLPVVRGPIIDVPQMVNVITTETLRDRQVISLEQALRNVAGVTTQIGEGGVVNGDQFFIRGQSAKNDIFTDGLRDFGAFTRDSFNYESVEVLKGSSSTALGRGVSGGAINTTSKAPATTDFFSMNGSAGSANYGRVTVDANKALTDSIGVRLNFMAHQNDSADRDLVESRRWGFAPAVGIGIGQRTSLTLVYFHQEETRVPDYGVPVAVTTPTDDIELPVTELGVPRSNFYGYTADTDRVNVHTVTAKLRHQANDWLSFTSDTKLGVYKRYFRQTVASCPAATCGNLLIDGNTATVPVATMGGPGPYDQTTKGIQNVSTALITKPIGGMRNELVLGIDFSYQTNDRTQFNYAATRAAKDLFDPAHDPSPALSATLNNIRDTRGTDISFFIDERLWFTPEFSVDAGLRFQHFVNRQDQTSYAVLTCNGVGSTTAIDCDFTRKSVHNLWNPKVSAIWEPSDDASFYVSYSKAAVPPGNSIGNGDALSALATNGTISTADLDPEKTETFDIGAKFGLFHNKLLVQTAVYQINRDNAKETDSSGNLFASSEPKQRLRGFELGLSGAVSKELLLTANYSYVDAEIRESFSSNVVEDSVGNQVRYVPKHAASAWATWKPVDGSLAGLEVGGGLNYQSKVYLNNLNTQVAPSYVVFDALLGYDFGNYRIALNGYNLTDKLYYAQVNGGRVLPAAGRTFVATLGVAF